MPDETCSFTFTDRNESVIACSAHKNERDVLKPANRKATLTQLVSQGKWGGRLLKEGEIDAMSQQATQQPTAEQQALTPAAAPQLPATQVTNGDLVEYQTPEGIAMSVSVAMFQKMICPDANVEQARYMMNWCFHNFIDIFAGEAYFSIMSGKPVIQVSKDCWLRRAENHPAFVGHDSGIVVGLSMNELKAAVVSGNAGDYLVPDVVKERLLTDALADKALDPKGFPSRLSVKKRGQFLAENETLLGAWALVARSDRPKPDFLQIPLEGWIGQSDAFWNEKTGKRTYMIWKSALKNCIRLAFPHLSGLLARPDKEDFDAAKAADHQLKQVEDARVGLIRELHAAGAKVPEPAGPLNHAALHDLAGAFFDGKGIAELSVKELSAFVAQVTNAQMNEEQNDDFNTILNGIATGESTVSAERDEPGDGEQYPEIDPNTGDILPVC